MEDFLPILLGLIFLGVKYYNKTQKDKAKRNFIENQTQAPVESNSSPLDDFIKQFYTEEKTTFTEPAYADIVEEEESIESWREQMHEQEPESIEYTDEHARKEGSVSQFETIQNKPVLMTERLDFDLRKAIVYDAIMNPPYL